MNLQETFKFLADYLGLDAKELADYATEDVIGGYNARGESQWAIGSVYEVEGQVLYALVRALKPAHVAEIGSLWGCSSTHIATALDINDHGKLTAVDVNGSAGQNRPKHLAQIVDQIVSDGLEWLAGQEDESIDLLFEDSSHGTENCALISRLAKTKLAPGGTFLTHDAMHDYAVLEDGRQISSNVGAEIRAGLDKGLGEGSYKVFRTEPSDCGMAIWHKPIGDESRVGKIVIINSETFEVVEVPPVEKPKRKPGRKPKAQA